MMELENRTEIDTVLLGGALLVNLEPILVKTATTETDTENANKLQNVQNTNHHIYILVGEANV